ncbi:hypothetical protein M076_0899 [Bacteroides fragilis str. 2-F-2 |uniref:Uncharacterized protein n=1 Tax=Bacteroides fragilis str. 2-F-2 \|nr:hypothetical protein M077_0954 [Bacteroides fragilis str. 2-F-2 \
MTKNHYDNWEKPIEIDRSVFDSLKTYSTPYLYNFDDGVLEGLNNQRLNQI